MTPRSLQAVLRNLSDAGPPVADAELLRRFADTADEAAFAELVRRHGRLVWTVCRTQTRSDAEADDAFQATFLVLLKNAGKVRDAAKLSAWLHGVAFKVCGKARRSSQRRTTREQATAHREGNGAPVPDSAWDRALAAVHAEVAKLPETLRVPFVLCCLEGKGVTEAAEQLGWKLGTLSGRLTRAKDAVLAKLDARGLTLGVVAAVGLATPPARAVAKTLELIHLGAAVPASILQLTHGVIGMSTTSVKVLAATVLLACGLGLSVGGGWVATAEAQVPAEKLKADDAAKRIAEMEDRLRKLTIDEDKLRLQLQQATREAYDAKQAAEQSRLLAETARAQAEKEQQRAVTLLAEALGGGKTAPEDTATFKTARNEYNLIQVSDITQTKFKEMVERYEAKGWEYCGTTPLADPKVLVWMFRRPVKTTGGTGGTYSKYVAQVDKDLIPYVRNTATSGIAKAPDDVKAVEAEIAKLTAKLAELKAKQTVPTVTKVTFDKTSSPIDPAVLASVLGELGKKKYGGDKKFTVSHANGTTTVTGDKDVIDWANGVVKSLGGK